MSERCRAELDRIRDALAGADVGQDEGLAFEVATLQAAWEEMHREAKQTRGAVEVAERIGLNLRHLPDVELLAERYAMADELDTIGGRGLAEDARDAGEASMQAAFWRARAIELGADENEYRNAHGKQSPPRP